MTLSVRAGIPLAFVVVRVERDVVSATRAVDRVRKSGRRVRSVHAAGFHILLRRALQIACTEELSRLESNLGWLATTAAVTPFIGLFGTVWGIMDAFEGLATGGAMNISSVAPGIAEALITTAAGLAAAIPAVIFYNHFVHMVRDFGSRMDNFSLEFQNLAERHYK